MYYICMYTFVTGAQFDHPVNEPLSYARVSDCPAEDLIDIGEVRLR